MKVDKAKGRKKCTTYCKNIVKISAKSQIMAIVILVAVVCSSVLLLLWALHGLPQTPQQLQTENYRGIIELWNVECFEGGVGSRGGWLTKVASKFELSNKGVFVHVTTLTPSQAQAKLQQGDSFDVACFSRGVGQLFAQNLQMLDVGTRQLNLNMVLAGQLDGKQLAIPLYAGSYCLFARRSQLEQDHLLKDCLTKTLQRKIGKNIVNLTPIVCGFWQYGSAFSALATSGAKGKVDCDTSLSQYEAYEKFLSNKVAITLLGTQRDLYRLSTREKLGKIEPLSFVALQGYTDLVQYVGVSANCGDKTNVCKLFIETLVSHQTQQTLTDVGMFSILEDCNIYTDERYVQCENALKTAYVPNVFASEQSIQNQRKMAFDTLEK